MLKLYVSTTSGIGTGWGINRWWTALLRRSWGCRWIGAGHDLDMCNCSPENQLYPGLHPELHGQHSEERDAAPLLCLDSICTALESSAQKGHRPLERVQRWATKMIREMEHLSKEKMLIERGCSVWKRKGSVDTLRGLPVLMKGIQKSWKNLFTRSCSYRTKSNGFKLKTNRFVLDIT